MPDTEMDAVRDGAETLSSAHISAAAVAEAIDEDGGWWKSCSGCHETHEGHETGHYPYSDLFRCHVGVGCRECGGLGVVWEYYDEAELAEMAKDPSTKAAHGRDARQDQVRDWVIRCWGEGAVGVNERVERFFEEAVELAQAEGVSGGGVRDSLEALIRAVRGGASRDTLEGVLIVAQRNLRDDRLARIVQQVYRKRSGEPHQEVGGVGTTLLAYCAAKGLSADDCERAELTRILGKPVDHFRARHAAKVESGLAKPIGA